MKKWLSMVVLCVLLVSATTGWAQSGQVSGEVWFDLDEDGVQDVGEVGFSGVRVRLLKGSGEIAVVFTNAAGHYTFYSVPAGSFTLEVDKTTLPARSILTTANMPQMLTVIEQEPSVADPIGYFFPGYIATEQDDVVIGDLVWHDYDSDGVLAGCEPGFANVLMRLSPLDGGKESKTVTDSNGNYRFRDIAPGSYILKPDPSSLPPDYYPTTPDFQIIIVPPGSYWYFAGDFGYRHPDDRDCDGPFYGSIGDTVWYDDNKNAVQDNELGIPGVKIFLLRAGERIATAVTDENGYYLFPDLPAGVYVVDVDETTIPADYELTTDNEPMTVDLAEGQHFPDADFGYFKEEFKKTKLDDVYIGDLVWYDLNANGVKEEQEPGLQGVHVRLTNLGTGEYLEHRSDQDGYYSFRGMKPGDYEVRVLEEMVPAGYVATTPTMYTVHAPEHDWWFYDADFGFHNPEHGGTEPVGVSLIVVAGSPTYAGQGWDNAVDGDLVGWEGTVTTRGDADGEGPAWQIYKGPAWAVFAAPDSALFDFDQITIQTGNGIDLPYVRNRLAKQMEIQVSSQSAAPEDFTSLLLIDRDGGEPVVTPLEQIETCRFIKLLIHEPSNTSGCWRQIVEFGVFKSNNQQNADLNAATMASSLGQPTGFELCGNYPNPFNPETTIRYYLPERATVRLEVFNLFGQRLTVLVDEIQDAGHHGMVWSAVDHPSGVYFYRLVCDGQVFISRMALVK
ncbi:T9SS type A sorting domain-containing protein [candidate division KSB1 bacterium]|nr:T9SS type A sorting domain-containing protein [candidate division KSB1 bacterium]